MVQQADSQVRDITEMLNRWQDRIGHLQTMVQRMSPIVRPQYDQMVRRMEHLLQECRRLLSQSHAMTPEQWIETRTTVLKAMQTLQMDYNAAVSDWTML